jgi:hypothetical protein
MMNYALQKIEKSRSLPRESEVDCSRCFGRKAQCCPDRRKKGGRWGLEGSRGARRLVAKCASTSMDQVESLP